LETVKFEWGSNRAGCNWLTLLEPLPNFTLGVLVTTGAHGRSVACWVAAHKCRFVCWGWQAVQGVEVQLKAVRGTCRRCLFVSPVMAGTTRAGLWWRVYAYYRCDG